MSDATGAVVKRSVEVPASPVPAGSATDLRVLIGPADGAENFVLRQFVMGPGGGMPLHTNEVEHEQFVVSGRGRVTISERSYDVSAGDVLLIPAGVPHSYDVVDAPFSFLCIVPNRPDTLRLVDTEDG